MPRSNLDFLYFFLTYFLFLRYESHTQWRVSLCTTHRFDMLTDCSVTTDLYPVTSLSFVV